MMLLQLFMWSVKGPFALPYPVETHVQLPRKKDSFPSFSFPIHTFQAIFSTERLFGLFVHYLSICLILGQNNHF